MDRKQLMPLNFCNGKEYSRQLRKQMDGWIIEQIKPKFSLEAQVTKFKLSYLGHIMHISSIIRNGTRKKKLTKIQLQRQRKHY